MNRAYVVFADEERSKYLLMIIKLRKNNVSDVNYEFSDANSSKYTLRPMTKLVDYDPYQKTYTT
jgi:hypothetical protein